MNYYFRSINPLDPEWSLFEQKKGSVTEYYAHSQMEYGDIVLLQIGKQDKGLMSGVYAVGEVVSDVWKGVNKRYQVKIKLLNKPLRNEPIISEKDVELFKGNVTGIRNCIKISNNISLLEELLSDYI